MPKNPRKPDEATDHLNMGDLKKRGEDAMQSFGRAALETGRGPMATLAGVALLGFAAGIAASLSKKAATEAAIGAVGDWVEALAAEHRQIESLFEQTLTLGATEHVKRIKLFRKLDRAMSRHFFAEEMVVYPTLSEAEADESARKLAGQHFDMRSALHLIEALDRNDPQWNEALRELYKLFAGHAHDEENEVFPALRDRLSPQQNARLTRDLAKRSASLA
jgi:hemerythrin superfamily protein